MSKVQIAFVERSALIEACRRYGPSVVRRCGVLVGPTAAEDVAQEVFVAIMNKGAGFRGDAEVATWIYSVTTNHCLNWLRSRRRREAREQSDAVASWLDVPLADPESRLIAKDTVAKVLEGLDELGQLVFVYRHVDGMSQQEIARVTGASRRAIMAQLEVIERRLEDIS